MSSTALLEPDVPSVGTVLEKIKEHNGDVLGCVVVSGKSVYHNLPDPYDLLDIRSIGDYACNIFALMDALETGESVFEEAFLEYQGHSFLARALDHGGVLLLVANPVKRGVFRTLQLGVGLFVGPLLRALAAEELPPAGRPRRRVRPSERLRRIFAGLA